MIPYLTYHKVSRKYLPLYVAEFQSRHNHRENVNIWICDSRLLRHGRWQPSRLETKAASEPERKQLKLPFFISDDRYVWQFCS
jgi:hypothetical protein